MNLKLVQILLLGCLLLECDFAFSQDTNSITVRGDAIHTTDNIFISNVKHIDTIYCISNPKYEPKTCVGRSLPIKHAFGLKQILYINQNNLKKQNSQRIF